LQTPTTLGDNRRYGSGGRMRIRGVKESITYAMKETGYKYNDLKKESGKSILQNSSIGSGMAFQTLIQLMNIMGYSIILRNRSDIGDYLRLRLNRYESEKWGNKYISTGEGSPEGMMLLRHNAVTEKDGLGILLYRRKMFLRKMDPLLFEGELALMITRYESDRSMNCRHVVQLVEYLGYEVIIKDDETGEYWRMIIDGERDQSRRR